MTTGDGTGAKKIVGDVTVNISVTVNIGSNVRGQLMIGDGDQSADVCSGFAWADAAGSASGDDGCARHWAGLGRVSLGMNNVLQLLSNDFAKSTWMWR